jgi:hypothetical protein
MNDIVSKLKTPEECIQVQKNASVRGRPDLVIAARKKEVELRAHQRGASSDVERECLEAVYAYEQVLSTQKGKKVRASRTWQMIERHGIIQAVERAVNRKDETTGYTSLLEMGLEDFTFEAVILRHRNSFSPDAVLRSEERINARLNT